MISIDTTPFEERTSRTRDRSNDATTCGYCRKRVPKGHECEQKREALKERTCGYVECGKAFKPTMHKQAYCCEAHKKSARSQREYLNKAKRPEKPPKRPVEPERNTIAPLEREWERAGQQAAQYVPVMGKALADITRALMRKA